MTDSTGVMAAPPGGVGNRIRSIGPTYVTLVVEYIWLSLALTMPPMIKFEAPDRITMRSLR